MKKNYGYIAVAYFLFRASYIGLSSFCLSNIVKQDMWISSILGFIIGFIPVTLYYKLCSIDSDLNIGVYNKIKSHKTPMQTRLSLWLDGRLHFDF